MYHFGERWNSSKHTIISSSIQYPRAYNILVHKMSSCIQYPHAYNILMHTWPSLIELIVGAPLAKCIFRHGAPRINLILACFSYSSVCTGILHSSLSFVSRRSERLVAFSSENSALYRYFYPRQEFWIFLNPLCKLEICPEGEKVTLRQGALIRVQRKFKVTSDYFFPGWSWQSKKCNRCSNSGFCHRNLGNKICTPLQLGWISLGNIQQQSQWRRIRGRNVCANENFHQMAQLKKHWEPTMRTTNRKVAWLTSNYLHHWEGITIPTSIDLFG